MVQRYFVTGTGTGIGKTFITAALARQAKGLGRSVMAYKPIISGYDDETSADSDTALLLNSLGLPATDDHINRISPWRYRAPLAPSMAARLENRPVDFAALKQHSQEAVAGPDNIVLIEGVGGVMVPINDTHTVLDWIESLSIPVIFVTGSYLGTISHTLTALAVLQQRGIPVAKIIVNETNDADVGLQETVNEVGLWTKAPVVKLAHQSTNQPMMLAECNDLLTNEPVENL